MKAIISLAIALAATPLGAATAAPHAEGAPSPGLVTTMLPRISSPQDTAHMRARVVRLSSLARLRAQRLGLTPGPAVRPARSLPGLAAQEIRLGWVLEFLRGRREVGVAIDRRSAARTPRGRTALAAQHARVARIAHRLGLDRPAAPQEASTPEARSEQIWRLRTLANWLGGRSEALRPHERPLAQRIPHLDALMCIAEHESSRTWDISTGNGYYGGLQMDRLFQRTYGPELYRTKGTADHWTAEEQMRVAERAIASRGFWPWPNTARACGVL